jgi:hypothetical protein
MPLTNTINFRNLQGDLFGGLTAAIVSLALAFSVASSAGSVAGLDVAVGVGFFAALFGQIRHRLRRADTPSHNLKLEDKTKCQVEFHDLCVHRSLKRGRTGIKVLQFIKNFRRI